MNVTLRKIGNSLGVIIPKEMLDRLGMKEGDVLDIESENASLMLKQQDNELAIQLKAARIGMEKYRQALNELAK